MHVTHIQFFLCIHVNKTDGNSKQNRETTTNSAAAYRCDRFRSVCWLNCKLCLQKRIAEKFGNKLKMSLVIYAYTVCSNTIFFPYYQHLGALGKKLHMLIPDFSNSCKINNQ